MYYLWLLSRYNDSWAAMKETLWGTLTNSYRCSAHHKLHYGVTTQQHCKFHMYHHTMCLKLPICTQHIKNKPRRDKWTMNVMLLRHRRMWVSLSNKMAKYCVDYALTLQLCWKKGYTSNITKLHTHHNILNSQENNNLKS